MTNEDQDVEVTATGYMMHPWEKLSEQVLDAISATTTIEVESLRKQVRDLTAEVARLKDQRRERIATAALQGLIACPGRAGNFVAYAKDAAQHAAALIAKLDGKED